VLRNRGITTIILAGVVTNVCVESTARDAWHRDFDVLVVSDATAGYAKDLHEGALTNIAHLCGAVRPTDEVIRLLGVEAKNPAGRTD